MTKTARIIYYLVVVGILIVGMIQIFGSPSKVELGLNEGLALTAGAFGLWILASVLHLAQNFKKSITALLGAGAVILVFVIAYSTATPVVMDQFPDLSSGMSKMISGGLITVYILGAACIVLALYSEVLAIFKS